MPLSLLTGIQDPNKEYLILSDPLIEASFSHLAFSGKVTGAAPVSDTVRALLHAGDFSPLCIMPPSLKLSSMPDWWALVTESILSLIQPRVRKRSCSENCIIV